MDAAEIVKMILCLLFVLFCLSAVFYRFFFPEKAAKLLEERERRKRQRGKAAADAEKAAADAEWNKLRGQATELFKNGAEVVVIAFRTHPDGLWEQGMYLPTDIPDEVKAAKFCVLTRDGKETWNQLPDKFKDINLHAFSQKCKAVYVDDYSQLVRDGWGTWNFVRRDGVLELVWKLTGYGEKERREREEKAPGSIYDLTHRGF